MQLKKIFLLLSLTLAHTAFATTPQANPVPLTHKSIQLLQARAQAAHTSSKQLSNDLPASVQFSTRTRRFK